jgi:hypothetical protein
MTQRFPLCLLPTFRITSCNPITTRLRGQYTHNAELIHHLHDVNSIASASNHYSGLHFRKFERHVFYEAKLGKANFICH